jgi:hypothetical protein
VDASVDAAGEIGRRAGAGANFGAADGRAGSNRISPSTVALVPCGHVCVCEECAGKQKDCPCCDVKVAATIRIFLS